MPLSQRFAHITVPREVQSRRLINVAAQESLLAGSRSEPRLPEEQGQFLGWLFQQAGLDVNAYRGETLLRRLPACLRVLRVATLTEAQALLESQPGLIQTAMSAMLVGVTSFFRDPSVFEALRASLLPHSGESRGRLLVWSIGCSDGAELYSVAMLLAELGLLRQSYLLGTDCRQEAIAAARAGFYTLPALQGVTPERRARFFEPAGNALRVTSELRSAARWRTADVLQQNEPGVWDLILFRNTSIYLQSGVTRGLWASLENALRPGGMLVLGKAERPTGAKRLVAHSPCIFRRARR